MNTLQQNSAEWLEIRKSKIGASDAPVIMGVSPWKTPFGLWEEKIGIRESQFVTNSMRHGLEVENEARECFEKKTNLLMTPEVAFHPSYDWMMASLDGIDTSRRYIVELKRANKEDHALAKNGKMPEKYYPQVQHQLEVTGLQMAYYFSYDGEDGVILEIERNEKYIDKMLTEEKEFFICMDTLIAPQMMDKDFEEHNDPIWKDLVTEYVQNNKHLEFFMKKEDSLKKQLVDMCNDKNGRGFGVSVSRIVRRGTIDYKSVPFLQGKNLEPYRKSPTEYWRVSKDK